ncbi:MAG: hypothetical protein U0797_16975 [Gemmataceae bacterium]
MPPDARPRLAPLEAWRRSLDSAGRAYAKEVQEAVGGILGAATEFDRGLRLIGEEVLKGQTAAAHALRERFLAAFEDRLRLLREARELVRSAVRFQEGGLPEVGQLEAEAEALERRLKNVAARWLPGDPESLEYFVAEELTPPAEKLKALAASHPPPQSWYDEE